MHEYSTLAAVDLGSNSFHLQVARVVDKQLYPLDDLKEMVQLAAGLSEDKLLHEDSQLRALACLERFGERLRGLSQHAVRVVGTNSLRVARNAADFLEKAEQAIGFPIEVIAGHEEARLIYLGVAHSLPASDKNRLVIDIGGGSTELIIGNRFESSKLESLYMGCINYSQRFFPDGKIGKGGMKRAELAARTEIQAISTDFSSEHWQEAYGASGTARALARILGVNQFNDGDESEVITSAGLDRLRDHLLKAGDSRNLGLAGLQSDREKVIVGGFAIMAAVFTELKITRMAVTSGALREGVLCDLLGRFHQEDIREVSVQQFVRRYRIDSKQANRIESLAVMLGEQLLVDFPDEEVVENALKILSWAARLHEIGICVAHTSFHKHSAYILNNADIPGFSRMEQSQLSQLALAVQGSLTKVREFIGNPINLTRVVALRLAAIFYHSRTGIELPGMKIVIEGRKCRLLIPQKWLESYPLTDTLLVAESEAWAKVNIDFNVENYSSQHAP
ncbi:MAG: exopolyphosphatase [Nitrosomonas sp.]|nr:exopolyphosphatase [Nitrosomonas sp.]